MSGSHEEFSDIWKRNPYSLSVMTQTLPRFSILKDIHDTMKWQSDNLEHLNSPWVPIFRARHSTPILYHPPLFCFHMLSSFRCFFLFLRKTCKTARSNPAENRERRQSREYCEEGLTSGTPEVFPVGNEVLLFYLS